MISQLQSAIGLDFSLAVLDSRGMQDRRCPHCHTALTGPGRFCGMCGRAVPAGNMSPVPDAAANQEPVQTKPLRVRSSAKTASSARPALGHGGVVNEPALAVTTLDATPPRGSNSTGSFHPESDPAEATPFGSSQHQLRAEAPGHRVYTSPLGYTLPQPETARSRPHTTTPEQPSESSTHASPVAASTPARLSSQREEETRRIATTPPGTPERSPRQHSSEGRAGRKHRSVEAIVESDRRGSRGPATPTPTAQLRRRTQARDRNAPSPVVSEATHYIPKSRRSGRLVASLLRAVLWSLLWLGVGGAVAFTVVLLLRRPQAPAAIPATTAQIPSAPSRPGVSAAGTTTAAPKPTAPPQLGSRPASGQQAAGPVTTGAAPTASEPLTRDLVVNIPVKAETGDAKSLPAIPAALAASGAAQEQPVVLSAQQQAAVQQNLSNIEFVVSERSAQVRACYQRILQAMPTPPSGRVTVSLTLTDEGRAEAIEILENTLDSPPLAACLSQRLSEWSFPRPVLPPGTPRTYRFPFVFVPAPEGASGRGGLRR